MKYYIIAGEASGDLHGSSLVKKIKKQDPGANIRGWGGDRMQALGVELTKHIRDTAFMGLKEVVQNLRTIMRNLKECKKDIEAFNPDVVILIDYPGFNMRIAEFTHFKKYLTVYYISPQIWAWQEKRVKKIRKYVDLMLVILPFEQEFYLKHGMDVKFTGHPLLDVIENYRPDPEFRNLLDIPEDRKIIGLIPGSRKQEIQAMLPEMVAVIPSFPDYEFVVAGAPGIDASFYSPFLQKFPNLKVVFDRTYDLYSHATAALVTSGTATLEAALFDVPEVVCYKGNVFFYWIAKRLATVEYISLVNLTMEKLVVKELIQDQLKKKKLISSLEEILSGEKRAEILADYKVLKKRLGKGGASAKAAEEILKLIKKQ